MLKVALFDFREPRYFMPGLKQRLITALTRLKVTRCHSSLHVLDPSTGHC